MTRGFSPELQVATDPRFGRTEEAFGEDPMLVTEMGVAYTLGMTNGNAGGPSTYLDFNVAVGTEAKHYAAYAYVRGRPLHACAHSHACATTSSPSPQGGKDAYRTDISMQTLFNVYLRPWRAYIQRAGGRGIMISHQETNGIPNHASAFLQTTVLRGMFGATQAFLASDYGDVGNLPGFGVALNCTDSAIMAVTAGLDQDLGNACYGSLLTSVTSGLVPVSYIDRSVANVLRQKFATGLFDGYALVNLTALSQLDSPAHRQLAYDAAAGGVVLLQNTGGLLPLSVGTGGRYRRIAVIGPNAGCVNPADATCDATNAQLGGYTNYGAKVVTVRAAIEAGAAAGGYNVTFARGANIDDGNATMIAAAVAAAAASDVAIVVLGDSSDGYGAGSCAEGIDADSLDLVGSQLPLLQALVTQTTVPIVLVGIHGRPFTLGSGPSAFTGANNALLSRIPAVLAAWRPGEVRRKRSPLRRAP